MNVMYVLGENGRALSYSLSYSAIMDRFLAAVVDGRNVRIDCQVLAY